VKTGLGSILSSSVPIEVLENKRCLEIFMRSQIVGNERERVALLKTSNLGFNSFHQIELWQTRSSIHTLVRYRQGKNPNYQTPVYPE